MDSGNPEDQISFAGISPDMMSAAFSGSREAYAVILDQILHVIIPHSGPQADTLAVAEFIARGLAATGDTGDATLMSNIMLMRASMSPDLGERDYGYGAAIASLNAAADRGDEQAAMHLSGPVIRGLPKEAFDWAKTLRTEAHR